MAPGRSSLNYSGFYSTPHHLLYIVQYSLYCCTIQYITVLYSTPLHSVHVDDVKVWYVHYRHGVLRDWEQQGYPAAAPCRRLRRERRRPPRRSHGSRLPALQAARPLSR